MLIHVKNICGHSNCRPSNTEIEVINTNNETEVGEIMCYQQAVVVLVSQNVLICVSVKARYE